MEPVGPRIEAAEDLDPQQLFSLYAEQRGLSSTASQIGARIIDGLSEAGIAAQLQRTAAVVTFERVELEGYLSFRCARGR